MSSEIVWETAGCARGHARCVLQSTDGRPEEGHADDVGLGSPITRWSGPHSKGEHHELHRHRRERLGYTSSDGAGGYADDLRAIVDGSAKGTSSLSIWAGDRIDAVQVTYSESGALQPHGGTGGNQNLVSTDGLSSLAFWGCDPPSGGKGMRLGQIQLNYTSAPQVTIGNEKTYPLGGVTVPSDARILGVVGFFGGKENSLGSGQATLVRVTP
jgi:hypothetical protein